MTSLLRKIFPEYKFTHSDVFDFRIYKEDRIGKMHAQIAVKKPGCAKYTKDKGVKKPSIILSAIINFHTCEVEYWETCNRSRCSHESHESDEVKTKSLVLKVRQIQ